MGWTPLKSGSGEGVCKKEGGGKSSMAGIEGSASRSQKFIGGIIGVEVDGSDGDGAGVDDVADDVDKVGDVKEGDAAGEYVDT